MSTKETKRNESRVGRLINSLRPIPKKLWLHKVISAIRVAVGAITFATMVFAGFYGYTAWMHQSLVVAEANHRRVEAETQQYNDLSKRWTKESISEIAGLPIVEFGYPRKEVTVQLTVDGKKHQFASLEGVIGREPELQGGSLVWGSSVDRESKPEILLSRDLYEKLGGRMGNAGPVPDEVSLVVTRVVEGTTETQRIATRISGVLRRTTDKVYGPLELAINLDRWQTHKSDTPLGESAQSVESLVVYDHVDAYVPCQLVNNVQEEEKAFSVRAEQVGPVDIVESAGEIWAEVVCDNDQEPRTEEIGRALSSIEHELWPTWIVRLPEAGQHQMTLVGLREDDPRWQAAGVPEIGELLTLKGGLSLPERLRREDLVLAPTHRPPDGVPDAYAVATYETLQWFLFDERQTPGVSHHTRVDIPNVDLAIQLQQSYPGMVRSSDCSSLQMYEVEFLAPAGPPTDQAVSSHFSDGLPPGSNPSRGSGQPPPRNVGEFINWLESALPACKFGVVSRGIVEVQLPPSSVDRFGLGNSKPTAVQKRVRIVPMTFFGEIVAEPTWKLVDSDSVPCVLIGPPEELPQLRSARIGGRRLKPLGQWSSPQTEIWVPSLLSEAVPAETTAVGFIAIGAWEHSGQIATILNRGHDRVLSRKLYGKTPERFWLVMDESAETALGSLRRDGFTIQDDCLSGFLTLQLPVRQSGRSIAHKVVTYPDKNQSSTNVFVSRSSASESTAEIVVGRRLFDRLSLRLDSDVLPGHARVPAKLFRRLAFEYARTRKELREPHRHTLTIRLPNVHALRQADSRLHESGYRLEPLVDLKQSRTVKFAVRTTDVDGNATSVPSAKADQLVMARPTFHRVVPRIGATARIADTDIVVMSSCGADDPLWFEAQLLAGVPLEGDEANDRICLSKELARRAFPALTYDEIIGRPVRIRLTRNDAGRSRDIAKLMRVGAISDSDACVAPLGTVAAWRLWQEGKLVYDNASETYRTPGEVYQQRGFISAVFYAASDESVQPLVDHLSSMGCEVKHQLDEQHRLVKLAVAVATLVVLIVAGSILNACANSTAVSWMDLTTKLKEIGVKMAYGVTRGNITLSYLAEGFLVGIAACLCGSVTVVATEPLLRDMICQTVGLGSDFFLIPIYSLTMAWLYGVAALVVVGFNMLGTLIPTWRALRKSPIELMRD